MRVHVCPPILFHPMEIGLKTNLYETLHTAVAMTNAVKIIKIEQYNFFIYTSQLLFVVWLVINHNVKSPPPLILQIYKI